jgi:bifunctional DNase/RNase
MRRKFSYSGKRRDFSRVVITILVIVIAVQAAAIANTQLSLSSPQQLSSPPAITPGPSRDPIPLEGYERPEVSVSPSVIYLTSGCRQLAMVTTEFQTYSIQNGLDKKIDFRPTVHDVFKDLIENFGMTVKAARIESLEESTYYAKLYVQQGSRILGLDAKPSDSIAVAVRFDAPVYVKSEIMETHGKDIC